MMVTEPCRLSSCVSAIWAIAPESPAASPAASICWASDSHCSPCAANKPLTAARSVLLNSALMTLSFCPCVSPAREPFRSVRMSSRPRILPCASYTCRPSCSMSLVASSVGDCRDRMMLRRCVPPSAPLMPTFASRPRAVVSSVVPPFRLAAVPPTVRMASPSWLTLALALLAALASLLPNSSTFALLASRFSEAIASVTRSDA